MRYTFAVDYSEKSPSRLCKPASVGPPGTLECDDLRIGAPTRDVKHVAEFDYRWACTCKLAVRLLVARDLRRDVSDFAVPIYAFLNDSNSVAGGFRVDYRTDKKRWALTLFVGAFEL